MSKIKQIRRLGHQFGTLLEEPRLDSYEIAEALYQAELIEYVTFGAEGIALRPEHYRETVADKLSPEAFRALIREALVRWCRKQRIEVIEPEAPKPPNPTDYYDPSDFGV